MYVTFAEIVLLLAGVASRLKGYEYQELNVDYIVVLPGLPTVGFVTKRTYVSPRCK